MGVETKTVRLSWGSDMILAGVNFQSFGEGVGKVPLRSEEYQDGWVETKTVRLSWGSDMILAGRNSQSFCLLLQHSKLQRERW